MEPSWASKIDPGLPGWPQDPPKSEPNLDPINRHFEAQVGLWGVLAAMWCHRALFWRARLGLMLAPWLAAKTENLKNLGGGGPWTGHGGAPILGPPSGPISKKLTPQPTKPFNAPCAQKRGGGYRFSLRFAVIFNENIGFPKVLQ